MKQIVSTISVDAFGRAIYPINMANLSVFNLAETIVDCLGYHTDSWIYPVGYMATRMYSHMKDPEQKCTYTYKIVDGGEFPK